jgi:hypothetical protein
VYIIIWRGLHASGKVREAECTHTYRNINSSSTTSNSSPNIIGKVHPITGPEGPEGSRGIALLTRDLSARRGWVVSTTPRPLYPRGKPGTHRTVGWVGLRAGLDVCEKSRPHRDSYPDRPARSQSLYRLSYILKKKSKAFPLQAYGAQSVLGG